MNEFITTAEAASLPAVDSTVSVSRRSRAVVMLDRLTGYVDIRDREAAIVVICSEIERIEMYYQIGAQMKLHQKASWLENS